MKKIDPEFLKTTAKAAALQSLKRLVKNFYKQDESIIITYNDETTRTLHVDEFKNKFSPFSDFCFIEQWHYMPNTIGYGFIGGYIGAHSFRFGTEPNFHFAFFDLNSGKIVHEFSNDICIKTGFKKQIAELSRFYYGNYTVGIEELLVYLPSWKIKPKRIKAYKEETEEEWTPYGSYEDDQYDSYMDGEADSYFYD